MTSVSVSRPQSDRVLIEPAPAGPVGLRPSAVVLLLGLSQIGGYGTLYYSFSILADSIAASFEWPVSWAYGSLSLAFFIGGLVAPQVGRSIDRRGAGFVMSLGSVLAAMTLLVAALSPNGIVFAAAMVGMQVAGALVQYNAAFAALVQLTGAEARLRITHLTLIAGFTSTLFWPLTAWLHDLLDWRQIYLAFAAVNLFVCLPVHLVLARQHRRFLSTPVRDRPTLPVDEPSPHPRIRRLLWFATIGFALAGFALSAMLAQLVPVLTALGLGASALAVSTLFGPAQGVIRFANMLIGVRRHPILAALIAVGMFPAAIAILALSRPWAPGAAVFVALLGFGSGLVSVVQGTLPLALFGSAAYGARIGTMAAVRQAAAAVAPFVLAFLIDVAGATYALWAVVLIGLLGLACMLEVARLRG